jgi:hypothetical protein
VYAEFLATTNQQQPSNAETKTDAKIKLGNSRQSSPHYEPSTVKPAN